MLTRRLYHSAMLGERSSRLDLRGQRGQAIDPPWRAILLLFKFRSYFFFYFQTELHRKFHQMVQNVHCKNANVRPVQTAAIMLAAPVGSTTLEFNM
jgi:hypothetical protein